MSFAWGKQIIFVSANRSMALVDLKSMHAWMWPVPRRTRRAMVFTNDPVQWEGGALGMQVQFQLLDVSGDEPAITRFPGDGKFA